MSSSCAATITTTAASRPRRPTSSSRSTMPARCRIRPGPTASWRPITDYLVEQAPPQGYLTAENAQWLIERIGQDGRVDSKTELELLVNVLDKARWAPQSLVRFALEQVKDAVVSGTGPLRSGKKLEPGIVFGSRRRSPAPHPLRRRQRRQHRHHAGRGRGAVRHRRGHHRPRQPSGLDRPFRQGHRQLRDGGVGLCRPAARGCACARGLARPSRRPLARRHAGRHDLGPQGPVRRLSRADRRKSAPSPA